LIWWLFRISSLLLLGGAVTLFVINLDSFENLGPQLLAEKQQLESLQLQLGSEANASEANMTTLLKVNRDLRKELESLEEGSQGAEDELGFLLPKIKSLQDQTSKIEEELKEANVKVESIEAKMEPEDQRIDTLTQQKEEVLVQLEEVSLEYTKAENDWRILDQNLSSLSRVREAALETYQNARESLLEEIVLPFEVFFGDSVEAEVESISSKENGFFVKKGLEHGFRTGFVFILQQSDSWEEIPLFVQCTLAEKNYSFFKIISLSDVKVSAIMDIGEKLSLIRTADLINSNNSPLTSSEKILSQNDL
jgi:phage shock protein A